MPGIVQAAPTDGREVYGKYHLVTKIATGGMAEVWLARSSSIGGFEKILAIKRMHPRLSASQGFISMFIEEAKLSVALNHPNIVQIFDFGRVDDNYYIAMEFVEGVDLSTLGARARAREKGLPVEASLFILRQVFEGLAYAHGRRDRSGRPVGIIHRDVSPHNVLVSFDGQVKISDFGIAKAAEELKRSETGEIVGKVAYMSPELARGEVITASTDVWGAGVILHELLVNARLFSRGTDQDTLEAVARLPIPQASGLNPAVPREVDALLTWILDRDMNKRAASARDVAEALGETLRVHFPRMNDYRLAEVIRELYDGRLPLLVPGSEATSRLPDGLPETSQQPPAKGPVESTAPAGQQTMSEIRESQRNPAMAAVHPWAAPISISETLGLSNQATLVPRVEGASPAWARPAAAHLVDDLAAPAMPRPQIYDVAESVARLKSLFVTNPNLWVLFDIGEIYEAAGMASRALGAYKLAAAKFAQRGLLVQAVSIYRKILQLSTRKDRGLDGLRRLREVQGLSDAELLIEIFDPLDDTADFSEYHGIFEVSRLGGDAPVEIITPTPILSSLGPEQFVRLVEGLRLRKVRVGEHITREGEAGDAFFWIGRGRVLVSATNFDGAKIYFSSLADGDCFGEQAFFTGKPRGASVEAVEEAVILEVGKDILDELIREFPPVQDTLRQFYKDRIAESHLARSPLFGHLAIRDRRLLAERFTFVNFADREPILAEGEASNAFYAVKSGRVEVYTGQGDDEVALAILEPGEVFGEIAALKGTPRTASVRALGECELLRLEAEELKRVLNQNPGIRQLIEAQIEARAEETIRKLTTGD